MEIRQRRHDDLRNESDEEDEVISTKPQEIDEQERFTWIWLPCIFLGLAVFVYASMHLINGHDTTARVLHAVSRGPRVPGGHPEYRLTKGELAIFDGVEEERIFIAVLGQVFDVTEGKRHYGKGGAYSFFAATDRSRAFSSGSKSDGEDVSSFTDKQLLDVHKWLVFFDTHKAYKRMGTVEGVYYDKFGHVTPTMHTIRERIRLAKQAEEAVAAIESCNSEWKAGQGSVVWCQDPEKYPRKHADERCGCFSASDIAMRTDLQLVKDCKEKDKRCVSPA
ncbi:neuferricin-like [Thraustotheca clavata]|uniref:Neuferricin-like n=1 Tax=Thraustotheca clavata TaxID=74557 RepID=A0A1V9ZWS7_9STRA|nr:neuferricin-like [Thraustotheca clavata]